jgi:exopolysaccharide production protein ExoZ
VAIGILAGVSLSNITLPRTVQYGVPATILIMSALLLEPLARRREIAGLKLLGDASYSLYLTHLPVIFAVGRVVDVSRLNPLVFVAIEILCSLAVGLLTYRLVEKPLLHLFRDGNFAGRTTAARSA